MCISISYYPLLVYHLIIASPCANEPSFVKSGHLAQLVKVVVAYCLGALPEVAGSNPKVSMEIYFHMYNGC